MRGTGGSAPGSSAILTLPNGLSLLRILLIPVFSWLMIHRGTEASGILLFAGVAATDWIDGFIARRTGQVSELGKVLDPAADRLALAAGLIALVVRGAFPPWAAGMILARDLAVLIVGTFVLVRRRVRIDVRFVGKFATLSLMVAVPWIAWGSLDLPWGGVLRPIGWVLFASGIVEYYVAAGIYVTDIRRALIAR